LPVSCRSLAGQGEGDTFAQVVWQVICVVEQFMVHEVLAVELAPVVVVDVVEPLDELDGTKQALWQVADCELQSIMQFVSVELCARRIFPSAVAPPANASIANTANTTANHRMTASTGRR
jgi:hypothetical protein